MSTEKPETQDFEFGNKVKLRNAIGWQMTKGAAVATAVFFGPVLAIYLIYLVGTFLPPESKEAVDPTPDSFSSVLIDPQDLA